MIATIHVEFLLLELELFISVINGSAVQ